MLISAPVLRRGSMPAAAPYRRVSDRRHPVSTAKYTDLSFPSRTAQNKLSRRTAEPDVTPSQRNIEYGFPSDGV